MPGQRMVPSYNDGRVPDARIDTYGSLSTVLCRIEAVASAEIRTSSRVAVTSTYPRRTTSFTEPTCRPLRSRPHLGHVQRVGELQLGVFPLPDERTG